MLAQLSLEELMSLFGEVRYDANHTPFIYVDDNVEKCWGSLKETETVQEGREEVEEEVVVVEEGEADRIEEGTF